MSGICGCVNWDGAPVPREAMEQMVSPVDYRGPDGIRTWFGNGVALAHLALRVTPESRDEVQPLEDTESGLVLVADARIDNREELIRALRGKGERLEGRPTDAELILAAYRVWDRDCPVHLLGDFAFAIWDARRRTLFLARDPMAMRNLHFRSEPGRFLFGTEARQIITAPGVPRELFLPAVGAHLAGGHGSPEWTFHAGVQRFLPAHALLAESKGIRQWRFWSPDPERRISYRNEEDYADHFTELMKASVSARLRSFRPAGLLLSGGVDSGTIAATAGWLRANEPDQGYPALRAYSFAWDDLRECDERHISGPLAEQCGLPVSEVPADDAWPLKPGSEQLLDPETPFLHGHYVLLEQACQQARAEGTGLMLSGDRGDLVGGMNLYDWPSLLWSGQWFSLLSEARTLSRWHNRSLWRVTRRELVRTLREAAPFHHRSWGSLPPFRRFSVTAPRQQWPAWLSAEVIAHAREGQEDSWVDPVPPFPTSAARERFRLIFTALHMHGIESSERMHARHHQGFADPWSDRRLAEFACQVPQRVLNRLGEPKRLVRKALNNLVPVHATEGMRKIVPTPLFERGLRDRGRPFAHALIHDSRAAGMGLVDQNKLHEAYQSLCAGGSANVGPIWRALSLELWLRHRSG